jgi:curved DNA-binding protein CbpA
MAASEIRRMSLKVELGLFNLDCMDYHAILGVPVDADRKDIRKQYLKIARRLHPDSCATEDEGDRQRAAEYLSKFVNPAYEKLNQEENYTDHRLLLKLKGEQAVRQQETVMLVGEAARRLASASGDVEQPYRAALRELTAKQYEHLNQTLEVIGQISELNLVYLMRTSGKSPPPSIPVPDPGKRPGPPGPPGGGQSTEISPEQIVARYLKRAKEFQNKGDFQNAVKEVRDALKLDPNNSNCHTLAGEIYLQTKQTTMAKIHFTQALKLDPKNITALAGLRKIDPKAMPPGSSPDTGPDTGKGSKPGPKPNKPESGGGLFGMFGGKKKK